MQSPDTDAKNSRRGMLGKLGTAAALAALHVAGGRRTEAAPGDPLILGQRNEAGGRTTVLHAGTSGPALRVANSGEARGTWPAIEARGHVLVEDAALAVRGKRATIHASSFGTAITAVNNGYLSKYPALLAQHNGRGIALQATSEHRGNFGTALYVRGGLSLLSAGKAEVPAGQGSVEIALAGNLASSSSVVLATAQGSGGVGVLHAEVVDGRTIRVTLTGSSRRRVRVGYMVLN